MAMQREIYGEEYHQLFKNKGICMHKKEYPKVEDVIEAIHQDQGVAILAHPRLSRVEALISHLFDWVWMVLKHGIVLK
mgnify:CR=1 FL=1